MSAKAQLYLKIECDQAIGHVFAEISVNDLTLPFDEFSERFLRPAYEQALRELRYAKEQTA